MAQRVLQLKPFLSRSLHPPSQCLGSPEGTLILLSCAGGFGKVYKATLRDGMQVTSATASDAHIVQLIPAKAPCAVLLEMYFRKFNSVIFCPAGGHQAAGPAGHAGRQGVWHGGVHAVLAEARQHRDAARRVR